MVNADPRLVVLIEQLSAEVAALRQAWAAAQAEVARRREELADAQAAIAAGQVQGDRLDRELKELKQRPFLARRRRVRADVPAGAVPKRRGRPVGHPGVRRPPPPRVDRTARIAVGGACPVCGAAFPGRVVERRRVVEDIEPRRPTVVTEYVIERRWCPACRAFREAPGTAALPRHQLGLHLRLFVVFQKVGLGRSYGKIQTELATYFPIGVSPGELARIVAEVARRFGPASARLVRLVRRPAALHIDETGWRIAGTNHWLWTFVNDVVALYVVSQSRGSKVPKAVQGDGFGGTVISDFFSAYRPLTVTKAKCWAHRLRDSHDLAKWAPQNSEPRDFPGRLHQLFLAMGLAMEEVAADAAQRPRVHGELRQQLAAFAREPRRDGDCQRLANRILNHLDELVVWLADPEVSATNNAAERALRPAVVTRKTSFGSRSKWGAHAFARLLSLIQTWDREGRDFFATAYAVLAKAPSPG